MDSNLKCAEITEQTAQQLKAMIQYKHSLITRTDRCSKRARGKERKEGNAPNYVQK